MARPYYLYVRAAVDAALHVQVEIERVVLPPVTPGEAVMEGRVARVFRGKPTLASSRICFEVNVCREGDDHGCWLDGHHWTRVEDLENARVIEAYLDQDDQGRYYVPMEQFFLLDAVTDTPTVVHTEEEARRLEDPLYGRPVARWLDKAWDLALRILCTPVIGVLFACLLIYLALAGVMTLLMTVSE